MCGSGTWNEDVLGPQPNKPPRSSTTQRASPTGARTGPAGPKTPTRTTARTATTTPPTATAAPRQRKADAVTTNVRTNLDMSPAKRARNAVDAPRPPIIPKFEGTVESPQAIPSDDDDDGDVVFLKLRVGSEGSGMANAQSLRSKARAPPGSTIASAALRTIHWVRSAPPAPPLPFPRPGVHVC